LGTRADTPTEAATAFQHWKDKVRHRHEIPEGLTQALLESETIDNVDADLLAAIIIRNTARFLTPTCTVNLTKTCAFSCALVWAPFADRFAGRSGARHCNGGGMDDGIWYLQHLKSELLAHTQVRKRTGACLPLAATISKR